MTSRDTAEVLERARSVVGRGIYHLGAGGMHPSAPSPFDEEGRCDCSGFVAWCLGISRFQRGNIDGDWIETTAMYRDAMGPRRMFVAMNVRQPGYLLVYPDSRIRKRQGHVGIISQVEAGKVVRVIHCSKGNSDSGHGAVQETAPNVFLAGGAVPVRFNFKEKT